MSTSFQIPFSTHDETHINLLPVGLKEAALDSPTFRAGFTHFSEQFDYLEKWLENYVCSVTGLSQEVANLERLVNGFLTAVSSPPHVSEAVIDHDHTLLAMRRYSEGAKDFWATTIHSLKRMDVNMVEPIRYFLQNDLRSFKETRRKLEQSQKRLEVLQLRYSAQVKSKDPASLREDASQLHEGRKICLRACMDFAVTAPSLRMALDKMLVKMFSDQWRDSRNPRDQVGGSVGRWGNDIERVRGWSRELENGEKMFRRELQTARKQIEENVEMALRPSRSIEDYDVASSSAIVVQGLLKSQQASARRGIYQTEKQGWLNLRKVIGKPARIAWLRRWFYVKNGLFGWFVQGSRSGGVEEGEKVGVLLCGVKIVVSEDRRYCFEVKTKDTTTILQTENQNELLEWIEAFETAQKKALEKTSTTELSVLASRRVSEAAFAILPPSAPEFTAAAADLGSDEASSTTLDRTATLLIPGSEPNLNPANKSSFDFSPHRGSTSSDREGESGRDHVLRIIQKMDLPRKSTSGPQMGTIPASLIPNSPSVSGGASGIASRAATSYETVPRGPGMTLQTPPVNNTARSRSLIQLRELPASTLAPSTLINPPTPTNLSGVAVMVTGERVISQGHIDVTDGNFTALMANIWGSSNWSYLDELRSQKAPPSPAPGIGSGNTYPARNDNSFTVSRSPYSTHKRSDSENDWGTLNHSTNLQQGYPTFYPLLLRPHEAQFRLLVPHARQDESLVLVFRASWNVNDTQEFPGRFYATAKNFYFYCNHLGLVMISEISLDLVSEITAAPGRDCDFLFIHLKVGHDGAGPTRITVKTFLEPLNLLQRRLNFLVRNCKTHQGRDLESVLRSLIKMEHDDSASSGSLESWEDVSVNTPFDEGLLLHRHAPPKDQHRDFRAKALLDGKLHSGAGKPDQTKGTSKFKLPAQPVDYEPSGMDRLAVNEVFDIGPKALFHVMFGDRSAVWQLLYHEGRAQRIRQGSWTQVKQGHLRREFEYQIEHSDMFGRSRQFTVVDYQIIDALNEHLCYVVTERKNPWYLPYSQHFQLLSRIVITHIAKSKCRLAIFTKVDWTKPPGFARDIVTRRALDDLEMDAFDLTNVITNQIKKLGAQCHTKKVVQIFGLIGQQTQVSEFMGSERSLICRTRSPAQRRTLAGLYLESFSFTIRSCISSLLIRAVDLLRWISKTVNANSILLSILVVSVLINLYFTSNRTSDWWRDRKTGKFMAQVGVGPNLSMSKAVYLHDLHDAVAGKTGGSDRAESTCHETFRKIVSLSDMDAPYSSAETLHFGVSSRESLRRLQFTHQQMGSYRHDLLVALRVVNSIEREMIQAELEHWLKMENRNCKRLEIVIRENRIEDLRSDKKDSPDSGGKGKYSHQGQIRAWHKSYCESCSLEHIRQLNRETGASERSWSS